MRKLNNIIFCTLFGYLLIALSGCAAPLPQQAITSPPMITGSITARNTVLLPPQSQVEIVLLDEYLAEIQAAGGGAETAEGEGDNELRRSPVIAKQIIKNPQVHPIRFSLRFDPRDIIDFRRYTITVNVYDTNDTPLYTSSAYPVLTLDNPSRVTVDLVEL